MREYTYSQARQNLSAILNSVCDDCEEIMVRRKNGDKIVLVDANEYESLKETAYLLSTEANRNALRESLREAEQGKVRPLEDLFK